MATPKASAVLRDVFRLTNRGTVLVVGGIEGVINIGDRLEVETRESHIIGIEMIDFSDPKKTANGNVGLLIHDTDYENLRALIGQTLSFFEKA
ncbi:MAG: hypothetical protein QNJ20_09900 [Paracoccaceae bacterium]|nr:hypothetical protein [Paracoccaceae bacterium]